MFTKNNWSILKLIMKQTNKILLAYLYTCYDKTHSLIYFLKQYVKNKPGKEHELLICLKLLKGKELREAISIINKYTKKKIIYIDPYKFNDYDFGSYYRIALKYSDYQILFLNSHSAPEKKNWLKKISKFADRKTLIGSTASFSSFASNSFFRHKNDNYFEFLKKIMLSNFYFSKFPNPHIRTSNFMLYGNEFVKFMENNKIIMNKFDTHIIESGKRSLTNYFLKKGFKIFVVNSDTKKFKLSLAFKSQTFCTNNQKKLLISDKHSRLFNDYDLIEKKKMMKRIWGHFVNIKSKI